MEIENEINIKRIVDIIISNKKIIVLILIITLSLGYFYSYYLKPDVYKSSETILLSQNEQGKETQITQDDLNINNNLITTYSNIAKSSKIVEETIKNLGIEMPISELQNSILVEFKKNTQIIEITIRNKNPQLAMELTKELTNVFIEEIKNIYNLENISIIDEAEVENLPYNVNHVKDISIFAFSGIFLIGILILVFYTFDDTIKEEKDIINYTGLRSLGTIPIVEGKNDNLELITHSNPKSFIAEAIRTVRTNILYMTAINKRKTILITSQKREEGKTWIANNMAVSFANANKKTIIVNCNLRQRKDTTDIFNTTNEKGLSDCIKNITKNKIENVELIGKYIQETQIPNLHILINGTVPPNPSELSSSSRMKRVINTLKYMYDIVILDSTPCLDVSDSIAIASMVDNVILVAEDKKTRISEIKKSKKLIEDVDGKILGVILNKRRFDRSRYYGKNYGYYGNSEENKNNIKIVQKNCTVEEIIEQAKINIQKEEKSTDKIIIKKGTNREKKSEVRIVKLVKRIFEKILRIQRNINTNEILQNNKEKELLQKQEKINNNIINQIYDFKIEQEKKNIDILSRVQNLQTKQDEKNDDFINRFESMQTKQEEKNNDFINRFENMQTKQEEKNNDFINRFESMQTKQEEKNNDFINTLQALREKQKITENKLIDYDEQNKIRDINIEQIENQNKQTLADINNLKIAKESIIKDINKLMEKNEEISNQLKEFKQERQNITQNLNTLKDKNITILEQIENLKEERRDINKLIQKLENKNMNISSDIENMTITISELLDKHNNVEENIEYLRKERKNIIEDMQTLKNKNDYIIDGINGLKVEKMGILETVNYLREDQKYIINDINNLKAENNSIIDNNEDIKEKNKKLETKNNKNLERIHKLHSNNKKMIVKIKELSQSVQELQGEIGVLKELNERLSNTEDRFSQSRIMQSMQINNINKQLEEIRKEQQSNKEVISDKNEKNTEKEQKNNVIINFTSLKQKNKKIKNTFSVKDDIMYDDLERVAEIVIDLKDNSNSNTKIANK